MEFIETALKDLMVIKPHVFEDKRGFFLESYSEKKFHTAGIASKFVQDNHSLSLSNHVLRGLHFQKPPYVQAKLVRVVRGSVFDVVVDLRKESRTFGNWLGFELSSKNFIMLYIPRGFAHGYCTLEQNTEFLYKADNFYAPEYEDALFWNDPDLNIDWPVRTPILSLKDQSAHYFKNFITPF